MAKDPVLPLYYNDLLGATQDWLDEEFGAYLRLLIYQWDKGFIPSDMVRLKKIADSAEKNWPVLSKKFTPDEQGFLKNSVMEVIRIKRQNFLNHQAENGRLGGRPKNPNETQTITQTITQSKPKKKPLEKEREIEKENELEKEKEIVMPFTSENFRVLWQNWKKYRLQEFGSKYKSMQSEQAALSHLAKLSGSNEETATEIISQSIGNQWQGLFELKNLTGGNRNYQSKTGSGKITGEQLNKAFAERYKDEQPDRTE